MDRVRSQRLAHYSMFTTSTILEIWRMIALYLIKFELTFEKYIAFGAVFIYFNHQLLKNEHNTNTTS